MNRWKWTSLMPFRNRRTLIAILMALMIPIALPLWPPLTLCQISPLCQIFPLSL